MPVVASEKGIVVGRLVFTEDGDEIDCSKARSAVQSAPGVARCRVNTCISLMV